MAKPEVSRDVKSGEAEEVGAAVVAAGKDGVKKAALESTNG